MKLGTSILVVSLAVALSPPGARAGSPVAPNDSVYAAHHPRLLFTSDELPSLRAKLTDGGEDDDAFAFVQLLAANAYPYWSMPSLLAGNYAMEAVPNLGLAAWAGESFDSVAAGVGRELTEYICDNYGPDNDEGNAGLRLRALALGYDMFFRDAPDSARTGVYDEIVAYLEHMTTSRTYELFTVRPYLGNHTAMYAGAMGLAAVCLQDEADEQLLDEAMALADLACDRLFEHQLDPDGSYKEGVFYGLWTMKNLLFYFYARERFDGYSYADNPRVRAMENAFAYELLPEQFGASNNINDSNYYTFPFARMTGYFDWAMNEWDSGLSAWMWDRTAGTYGYDAQQLADKAATVLWHRPVTMVHPSSVLANKHLWVDRGLYYFRTGWQSQATSDDVVFSFYSGKFHGGHSQEDQNHFTLYGCGDKYAVDHGSGDVARQSESHNMVFVDGAGQHNSGYSIGTDGDIAAHLLGGFADYLLGDATDAYTTHSRFNNPDWPIPGTDWSWGYTGANPVLFAKRCALVVHGDLPPYFVIIDDIEKDGLPHDYQWRLHTRSTNAVDPSGDPIVIDGDSSSMDVHVLGPDFASLASQVDLYSNATGEPDSRLLRLSVNAVNPHFAFLLFPHDDRTRQPVVTHARAGDGFTATLDWGDGVVDYIVHNPSGDGDVHGPVETDAVLSVTRVAGTKVRGYLAVEVGTLSIDGVVHAECTAGRMGCERWGPRVDVDRYDAAYRIRHAGVQSVYYREQALGFVVVGGYIVPDGVTAVEDRGPSPALRAWAYPNPFNPTTTIAVRAAEGAHLDVVVYDVAGRRVRRLWNGRAATDELRIEWDGRNDDGRRVASGTYFVRVSTSRDSRSVKALLLE